MANSAPRILVSALGMMLAGLLFILFFKGRKKAAFRFIAFGGLTWFVAVMLKFAWAIPINRHVQSLLNRYLLPEVANPLFWIYVGLLTGIFECGLIYLLFRFTRLKTISLDESYGFGYGFGSIEAIILGVAQLLTCIAIATGHIPGIGITWLSIPAPIIERIMTIFLHLYTTLLIIYSIKESKPYLFWLSFLYKSFVDAIAAWAQLSYGVSSISHLWIVEGIIFVATLPSIFGAVMFLRREKTNVTTDNTPLPHNRDSKETSKSN
jgi:uncharacterized membrane protein YhfC